MIEELKNKIKLEFSHFDDVLLEGDTIIIEDYYEMTEYEKNSDDCCDVARENGESIIDKFPELEITEYLCHRNKYAITYLKMKNNEYRII